MIQETVALIQSVFSSYGAWSFFLLGFAEEVAFFIPSPLLFLALGFFGISQAFSLSQAAVYAFGPIAFAGAAGVTLGAFFMYALAYFGGRPLVVRFGRYAGINWGEIEKARRFFTRGYADEIVLVVLRAIPIFPISVISLVCGVVRIRPLAFAVTTFAGSLVRIGGLSFFGWYAGREFFLYAEQIASLEKAVVVCGAFAAILYIIFRLRRPATQRRSE